MTAQNCSDKILSSLSRENTKLKNIFTKILHEKDEPEKHKIQNFNIVETSEFKNILFVEPIKVSCDDFDIFLEKINYYDNMSSSNNDYWNNKTIEKEANVVLHYITKDLRLTENRFKLATIVSYNISSKTILIENKKTDESILIRKTNSSSKTFNKIEISLLKNFEYLKKKNIPSVIYATYENDYDFINLDYKEYYSVSDSDIPFIFYEDKFYNENMSFLVDTRKESFDFENLGKNLFFNISMKYNPQTKRFGRKDGKRHINCVHVLFTGTEPYEFQFMVYVNKSDEEQSYIKKIKKSNFLEEENVIPINLNYDFNFYLHV